MTLPRRRSLWFASLALTVSAALAVAPGLIRGGLREASLGAFQVKPYVQPGDDPDGSSPALLWQTDDRGGEWTVETRAGADPGAPWVAAGRPTARRIDLDGLPPFRLYRASLADAPKAGFRYRVLHAGAVAFEADGPAVKQPNAPERFVVFGDCAAGTSGQRAVAFQAYQARPDYVVVTGDVVYSRGRVSEYLDHFFPVYNADEASPSIGGPLLRSTPVYAVPGNHDLIEANLNTFPDGLAFFYYWALPLNGPTLLPGTNGVPLLKGSDERQAAFRQAAGTAFPKSANYSFNRNHVHWTVLDANPYADWADPSLRKWLEADLASSSARRAAWRFVAFHHPPFNSSKAHGDDQRMRLLAPLFETAGVSVVFSGHVHNYQRTRPLKFTVGPPHPDAQGGRRYGPSGRVDGRWALDTSFDGASRTRPDGVIYVVTGAGGARLYNPEQHDRPDTWQDFTARFVSDVHSLTVADVTTDSLTLRQISATGAELDRIVITR